MSTIYLPYQGEVEMLKRNFGVNVYSALYMRLYTTDRTPQKADDPTSYAELSGYGYSAYEIVPGTDWTIDSTLGYSRAVLSQVNFNFTSGPIPRITGFYITDLSKSFLFHAEKFSDGPYINYSQATLDINFTLKIPLTSGS